MARRPALFNAYEAEQSYVMDMWCSEQDALSGMYVVVTGGTVVPSAGWHSWRFMSEQRWENRMRGRAACLLKPKKIDCET